MRGPLSRQQVNYWCHPPEIRRVGPLSISGRSLSSATTTRFGGFGLRRPRKQRHTTKRIFERLKDEYGFDGGYTTVKDYVRENRRQTREMFVPLSHPPGHAQCDFGEALVVIGGVERKAHCFVIDLPHSDGCFVKAYPAETTEAFLDGHVSAFAFLGGVPQSILYDNTRLAVAKILGDGWRQRTRVFTELQSHYLFEDRIGRPGKGNDKGKVEGLVGYARRNFLVPVPSFGSFDALNAYLERRCLERMDAQLRGHTETIGQRMERAPGRPAAAAAGGIRRVRQAGKPGDFAVSGPVQDQRLLGAGGLRISGRAGTGLRRRSGDQLRNRGHRQPSQIIRTRRLRLRPHPLPAAPGTEAGSPGPGRSAAGLGSARGVRDAAPSAGSRMDRRGKREYVQVLRLLETFSQQEVQTAIRDSIRLGALSFDAVQHLVLCRLEGRLPRLDLEIYPYLPRVRVSTTSAGDYMTLLSGRAA